MNQPSIKILGLKFPLLSQEKILDRTDGLLSSGVPSGKTVFTPNAEILFQASKDEAYLKTLSSADLLIPDGIGIHIASKMIKKPFPDRTTGIEIAEHILIQAAKNKNPIFLLGGKPNVAEQAKIKLEAKYCGISICGTHHGYFNKDQFSAENQAVLRQIKESGTEILFVCFGAPLQEYWIAENACKISTLRLSMGLGGCLDVWSENVMRAPKAIQKLGLEWLFRTLRQPKRITRLPRLIGFLKAVKKHS